MASGHTVVPDSEENVGLRSTGFTCKFLLYCRLQNCLFYHLSRGKTGLYCHLYKEVIILLTRQIISSLDLTHNCQVLLVHLFVNSDFIVLLRLVTSEIIRDKCYLCDQQKQIMNNASVTARCICKQMQCNG